MYVFIVSLVAVTWALFLTNCLTPPLFLRCGVVSNSSGTCAAERMEGTVAAMSSFLFHHLTLAQSWGLFCLASYALDRGRAWLYPGRWECSAKYSFQASIFSFTFALRPPGLLLVLLTLAHSCSHRTQSFSISISHLVFLVLLYTLKKFTCLWKFSSALFCAFVFTLP